MNIQALIWKSENVLIVVYFIYMNFQKEVLDYLSNKKPLLIRGLFITD
jgi:hypothetical protein